MKGFKLLLNHSQIPGDGLATPSRQFVVVQPPMAIRVFFFFLYLYLYIFYYKEHVLFILDLEIAELQKEK
jgi:hypothetical protein